MIPCKYSEDGYCIRPESEYCLKTECKGCDHKDTSIVVLEIVLGCETTAVQCDYCGEFLTKPKTEC
jgi:ribosomal protein S27E